MKPINNLDRVIVGWMSISVLLISTCIAFMVYADFGGSTCAFVFSFVICSAVQLMALLSIVSVADALCSPQKDTEKKHTVTTQQTEPEAESEQMGKKYETSIGEEQKIKESVRMSEEEYEERNRQHCNESDARQNQLTDSVLRYTGHVFAPFLEPDQLAVMLEEMRSWCMNPHYKPKEIELRYISEYSGRLKVLDMKHFIWNVGVRLGTRNGYTGEVRATFIKAMFPELLADNTISSLCNQTHDAERGLIVLDMPKMDSTDFTTIKGAA